MLIPTRYGAVLVTFLGNLNQGAPVWNHRMNDGRRAGQARGGLESADWRGFKRPRGRNESGYRVMSSTSKSSCFLFLGDSFKIGIFRRPFAHPPFGISSTHRSFRRGLARLICGVRVASDPIPPRYHSPNENRNTVAGCEKFEAKNRWEERAGRYTKRAKRVRLLWLAGFGP